MGFQANRDSIGETVPPGETLFDQLSKKAHERILIKVGNPALTSHRGFWKPSDREDEDWRRQISRYIEAVKFRTLEALGGDPSAKVTDRPSPPVDIAPGKSTLLAIQVNGLEISIIFEMFDEFFSQMVVTDFAAIPLDSPRSAKFTGNAVADHHLHTLHQAFVSVETSIAKRFTAAQRRRANGDPIEHGREDPSDKKMLDASRAISIAWQSLYNLMFYDGEIVRNELLFADFIGLSLGIDIGDPYLGRKDIHDISPRPKGKMEWKAAEPLPAKTEASLGNNIRPRHRFEREEILNALTDAVWSAASHLNPFYITDRRKFDEMSRDEELEWRQQSFSTINRSRSLYVTSLGGARPNPAKGVRYPLSYILLSPHRATWQIGRITDRIHSLGLFRLAALRQFDEIQETNDAVRGIIKDLENDGSKPIDVIERKFRHICRKRFEDEVSIIGYNGRIITFGFFARLQRTSNSVGSKGTRHTTNSSARSWVQNSWRSRARPIGSHMWRAFLRPRRICEMASRSDFSQSLQFLSRFPLQSPP